MKPITVDNVDGRTLLALRAGPMTQSELAARNGQGPSRWLIKDGYITQDDSFFRLTEAGRAACPYRNPLAKPGVVPPATYKPEIDMSRETVVTRQQVLAVIKEAGAAGISKLDLATRFEHLVHENAITSHLVMLKKDGTVSNPSRGTWVATDVQPKRPRTVVESKAGTANKATHAVVMEWLEKQPEGYGGVPSGIALDIGCSEESTRAVLAGLYAGMKVDREKVGDDWAYFIDRSDEDKPAVTPSPETPSKIALKSPLTVESAPAITAPASAYPSEEIILPGGELAIPSRKQIEEIAGCPVSLPTVVEDILLDNPDDVEFAIFSSGGLDIYCGEATVSLNKAVFTKLCRFTGLFQEAA